MVLHGTISYGGVNGLYIVISDWTKGLRTKLSAALTIDKTTLGWKVTSRITTFILILYTWLYFRVERLQDALIIQKNILKDFQLQYIFSDSFLQNFGSTAEILTLLFALLFVSVTDYWQYKNIDWKEKVLNQQIIFRWVFYGAILFAILIFGIYGVVNEQTKFIYFQF